MKIVHLVDRFPKVARYQDYYLAKYHAMAGHDVIVITSTAGIWDKREEKEMPGEVLLEGFRLLRLDYYFSLGNGPILIRDLIPVLEAACPDIIIVHDFVYKMLPFFVAHYSKKHRCKIILDNHASYINTRPRSTIMKSIFQSIYSDLFIRYVLPRVHSIIAIAEPERDLLLAEYKLDSSTVGLIPLGVDCECFKPDESMRKIVRAELKLSIDDIVIISTGKFNESKQIHTLIKAVARIISLYSDKLKLLLVGKTFQSSYDEELKDLICKLSLKERVVFQDFAPSAKLATYFQAADIAVYPGSPSISIQEAMGSGLPIILPSHTAYWKDYLEAGNGFTFFHGDEYDLAEKISLLLDTQVRQRKGHFSRLLALKKYDWKIIARQFLE